MRKAEKLTLIDLMAVVCVAAIALAWIKWRGTPSNRVEPILSVIVLLAGILWHRQRGGRGILGGVLGGAAYTVFFLPYFFTSPQFSKFAGWSGMMIITLVLPICISFVFFGAILGTATWLLATAMGRPRVPSPPTTISPDVTPELN